MMRTIGVPAMLFALAGLLLMVEGRREPETRTMNVVVIGRADGATQPGPLTQRYGLQAGVIADDRVFKSSGDAVQWLLLDPFGQVQAHGALTAPDENNDPVAEWRQAVENASPRSCLLMYSGGTARPTTDDASLEAWLPQQPGAWALVARREDDAWVAQGETLSATHTAELAVRPRVLIAPPAKVPVKNKKK